MIDELAHILAVLGEECGEVQQVVGKSLRFGIFDIPPNDDKTNFELIRKEVHDVVAAYVICKKGWPVGINAQNHSSN